MVRKNKYHWISLQVKPVGDGCNLRCTYCYNPKRNSGTGVMSEKVLDNLLRKYIAYSPEHLTFSWHGGEPTMAGLVFYELLEKKLRKLLNSGQTVFQMMQTNATLVNDGFAEYFKRNDFNIGVSLDGPEMVHSQHRLSDNGKSSFLSTMRGIEVLRKHKIDLTVISTITKRNCQYGREILRFFVENGLYKINFSPVAYISGNVKDNKRLALNSSEWFKFLRDVFFEWCDLNDPRIQIREINEIIAWTIGKPLNLCSVGKGCTHWLSVDSSGDVSACEYFNLDKSFGNVLTSDFEDILKSGNFLRYDEEQAIINPVCRKCEYFNLCGNGCSRMRKLNEIFDVRGKYIYCGQRKKLYNVMKEYFDQIMSNKKGGEKEWQKKK